MSATGEGHSHPAARTDSAVAKATPPSRAGNAPGGATTPVATTKNTTVALQAAAKYPLKTEENATTKTTTNIDTEAAAVLLATVVPRATSAAPAAPVAAVAAMRTGRVPLKSAMPNRAAAENVARMANWWLPTTWSPMRKHAVTTTAVRAAFRSHRWCGSLSDRGMRMVLRSSGGAGSTYFGPRTHQRGVRGGAGPGCGAKRNSLADRPCGRR